MLGNQIMTQSRERIKATPIDYTLKIEEKLFKCTALLYATRRVLLG